MKLSFIILFIMLASCGREEDPREVKLNGYCIALASAVHNYYNEHGEFPYSGNEGEPVNAKLLLPYLYGDNERKVKYLSARLPNREFKVYMDFNGDLEIKVNGKVYPAVAIVTCVDEDGQTVSSVND